MHVHLDVEGGISGDMFCSAMLDAFPELEKPLQDFLSQLSLFEHYSFQLKDKKQKEIMGKQFIIINNNQPIVDTTHILFRPIKAPHKSITSLSQHEHYSWQSIQEKLQQIKSHTTIYQSALAIYTLLAAAESEIHGITLETISLHEVGADDAILDIISAAFLIQHSRVLTWSCSSLPWGQGVIKCAHGELPVPAPATLKILTGFEWSHDSEVGERITPTGAAILAWLIKHHSGQLTGVLIKNGCGCGNRQFKNKANILRINVFADNNDCKPTILEHDSVYMVQCDIDDMSQESLAIAQEKLRANRGVIDLTSHTLMGKKGRWMTRMDILSSEAALNHVCLALLLETTTLGVRYWQVARAKLTRQAITVHAHQADWPVKIAVRPDGDITAKLEADTLQTIQQVYSERQRIKNEVEQLAIDEYLALPTRNNHD